MAVSARSSCQPSSKGRLRSRLPMAANTAFASAAAVQCEAGSPMPVGLWSLSTSTVWMTGISSKHTLALTNRGGATAEELAQLARFVQSRVQSEFGIMLQPEPVLIGVEL